MRGNRIPARINVKALIILVVVVGVLGVGAVGGHYIRKRVVAQRARTEGEELLQQEKWAEACKKLRRYLRQYPDDVEMLEVYAGANLAVRPRALENISAAIAAYRRLWRHQKGDDQLSDQLIKLYMYVGDLENATYICEGRLQEDPADASATLALARILLARARPDEAVARLQHLVETTEAGSADAFRMLARIAVQQDTLESSAEKALHWLVQGVERNPDSAEALVNRALFHLDNLDNRKSPDKAQGRTDLEAATGLSPQDPQLLLKMARAWAALGEPERAQSIVESLERVEDEVFVAEFANPNGFRLERFGVAATVRRMIGDRQATGALADRALDELFGQYRTAFLPIAVDLYLVAGRAKDASRYLAEHREQVHEATGGRSAGDQDLAILGARVALANSQPYGAIDLLKPVVAWNPDNETAWQVLAEAYIKTDQPDQAIKALNHSGAPGGSNLALAVQIARQHIKVGEWAEALRAARSCEEWAPDNLEIKLLRIETAMRVEFKRPVRSAALDRLAEELAMLRERYPEAAVIRLLQSLMAEHDGDFKTAGALLQGAIDECGAPLAAMMRLAQLFERRGSTDKAAGVYRQATQAYPAIALPWIGLGRLHLRAGRHQEAKQTLQQAAESVDDIGERRRVTLALAGLHLEHLDREQGITLLKEFAAQCPDDLPTRLALLEVGDGLGDTALAQQYIEDIRSIEGESGLSWRFHQSRMQLSGDDWREHTSQIKDALTECIEHSRRWRPRSVLLLGTMYESLGDTAAAETVYRREFTTDPGSVGVAERLLRLLESQRRFTDAKDILDRVTQPAPQLDVHRIGVAIGVGEYGTAIRELEARLPDDAQAPEPRIILARLVYSDQGDVERAFALLDEAEKLDPDGLSSLGVRTFILNAEGRREEAQKLLNARVAERDDFGSYVLRAQFYMAGDDHEAAERDLLRLCEFTDAAGAGHELLGRFYSSTARPQQAVAAWERGLTIAPDRDSMRRALMRALLAAEDQDRKKRGIGMLDDLTAAAPDDVELMNLRAAVMMNDGGDQALRDARALLERVVELDASVVTAHLSLMELAYLRGDMEDAAALVRRALNANPEDTAILMAAAQVERLQQNYSMAGDFAWSALKVNPRYLPAHFLLIEDALRAGDHDRALALADAAVDLAPDDPNALLKRAAVLAVADRTAEAISIMEDLVARDIKTLPAMGATSGLPARAREWLSLADLYCREGRLEDFESALANVDRLADASVAALRMRLRCHALQKRFDQIMPLVQARRASRPDDTGTTMVGAMLLASSGSEQYLRMARTLFEEVVAAESTNVEARLGIAQTAYQVSDHEAAVEAYREVLALDQANHRALNDLSWILAESGGDPQLAQSIKLADRGVEYYPADPHLRDTRGVVLFKIGRLDEAVEELERAIDFAQDLPTTRARAMIHLAEVYKKQGASSLARKQLQQAQAIDREHQNLSEEERAKIAELLAGL
ncbi:MAG: tetratricopeptide repeat protein [Phycisphaerae bacterium]